MKKLTKLAALLLAGAMALVLFTACSGDNSQTANKQAETQYMAAVNAQRATNQQLSNDPEMQQKAREILNTAVNVTTGKIDTKASVKIKMVDGKWIVAAVANFDYAGSNLEEFLKNNPFLTPDVNVDTAGLWTRVGVVVETINGHTYIAVAVERTSILGTIFG